MPVTMRQIVQEVGAATYLDDVLDIIVHRVKEALSIDACTVYLTDVESSQYVLMAADGFHQVSLARLVGNLAAGLILVVGNAVSQQCGRELLEVFYISCGVRNRTPHQGRRSWCELRKP